MFKKVMNWINLLLKDKKNFIHLKVKIFTWFLNFALLTKNSKCGVFSSHNQNNRLYTKNKSFWHFFTTANLYQKYIKVMHLKVNVLLCIIIQFIRLFSIQIYNLGYMKNSFEKTIFSNVPINYSKSKI